MASNKKLLFLPGDGIGPETMAQVRRVAETPIVQDAWKRGQPLLVHGLVYGLSDGRLRNLGCTLPHLED